MKRLVIDLKSGKVSEETFTPEPESLETLKANLIEEALSLMLSHRDSLYPEWKLKSDLEDKEVYFAELIASGNPPDKIYKSLRLKTQQFIAGEDFILLLMDIPAEDKEAFSQLLKASIRLAFRLRCKRAFKAFKDAVLKAGSKEELPSLEAFRKSLPTFITRLEP